MHQPTQKGAGDVCFCFASSANRTWSLRKWTFNPWDERNVDEPEQIIEIGCAPVGCKPNTNSGEPLKFGSHLHPNSSSGGGFDEINMMLRASRRLILVGANWNGVRVRLDEEIEGRFVAFKKTPAHTHVILRDRVYAVVEHLVRKLSPCCQPRNLLTAYVIWSKTGWTAQGK